MSAPLPRPAPAPPRVFTPYQLNDLVNRALGDNLAPLWIEGELGDVSERGGHVYFSLRDADASVRGVIFASDVRRVRHLFADGLSVRLKVEVGLFVPRGQFQIRAMVALPAGEGDRAAEVLRLRKKLAAEGLLDPLRKRKLPTWPQVVGIVTSRSGAALHDIAEVAKNRMPVRLVLAHATVQGPDAPRAIALALTQLARLPGLDVILLARGGGAQDDLSAFDEELVARAIVACPVPVVTGVGHEVDVTTADLVADLRAATPSHAAELTIPARDAPLRELERARARAERSMRSRLLALGQHVERRRARLTDPRHRVARLRARLDQARATLERVVRRQLSAQQRALTVSRARLAENEPRAQLARTRAALSAADISLHRAIAAKLAAERARVEQERDRIERAADAVPLRSRAALGEVAARLHALSPLAVLGRGYAIAMHAPTGQALRRAGDAQVGDKLELRLSEGTLEAEVTRVRSDADG